MKSDLRLPNFIDDGPRVRTLRFAVMEQPDGTETAPDVETRADEPPDVVTAAADVQTGAMIAFAPSVEDAMRLAIDGGDPVDQLHCTAIYLGDAADFDDEAQATIIQSMKEVAAAMMPIVANVFGFAILNPDGPEPCLVANVGGADLDEGFEIIDGIMEETGIEYAEQHEPRLAHITLGYDPDPRRWMTDDLFERRGPVALTLLRVAFAGVVTDIPLGETLAAAAFHLEGKHNQSTHGRGGIAEHASAPEVRAAYTLNEGGTLGNTGAEGEIADGIRGFTGHNGGFSGGTIDPHERSSRGAFVRTVAAAPPTAPKLHRGMTDVPPGKVPREGESFDLGPSSFSSSSKVADHYASDTSQMFNGGDSVRITLKGGSRSLRVDRQSAHPDEKEWVSMGRYRVTKAKSKKQTVKIDGKKVDITVHDIEVEQVIDGE